MQTKTAKFGGTSLADAEMFRKVYKIVKSNPERRFIVPSAPGKRFPDDEKITDLLYRAYDMSVAGRDPEPILAKVFDRFSEIIDSLGMNLTLKSEFDNIRKYFGVRIGRDFFASRGEYLSGIILANLLGFEFIDAADVIFFGETGEVDDEKTYLILKNKLSRCKNAVIPGFYGTAFDGTIKTFPRGGSDITGAIVANASSSDVYENWTDVSGVLMADPKIVENPIPIKELSFSELREMSYMGASVLHEDAVYPVRNADIPINIKNTFRPEDDGTVISSSVLHDVSPCGIVGKRGFEAIIIEKNSLSADKRYLYKLFDIFDRNSVPVELMPIGVDSVTVIVKEKNFIGKEKILIEELKEKFSPDEIKVIPSLSLVSIVGSGVSKSGTVMADVISSLALNGITPLAASNDACGTAHIFVIESSSLEKAIRGIYSSIT